MLTINVTGVPVPQGSHRGFVVNGRAVITQDNKKTKPWRADVAAAAVEAMAGNPPLTGPLRVTVRFWMPRPGYHFRTGKHAGELKPGAPTYVDKKPDSDKLLRSILDALTSSGVFRDDAQVAEIVGTKRYAIAATGAQIEVEALTCEAPAPSRASATDEQETLL